jgi:hypothetical protein
MRASSLIGVVMILSAVRTTEFRMHHHVAQVKTRTPVLDATTISFVSEEKTSETYLIQTADGRRLEFERSHDVSAHKSSATYRVGNGKPVTVTLDMPYKSKTLSEATAEMRQGTLKDADVPITIEGNGTFKTSERALNADADGSLHSRVRGVVSEEVAAAFTALQPIFGMPDFGGVCATIPFITGKKCSIDTSVMVATVPPDCDFDASFGKPCAPGTH